MIMKERVLVVGANGFIGKHLINELISNEIPVTAIIKNNSDTAKLKKLGCYNIIRTNNFNDSAVIRQLLISGPKYIINCAWEKNNKNILLPVENTQILIELLKLTEAINCEGFINIGTYEEYGFYKENISENSSVSPKTEFGKLKYAHCLLLFEIAKSSNLKACHIRLSEAYSVNKPDEFIFNKLIKNISKGISNNIKTTNKKIDYIFVSDICRGIIQLIENGASGIFNIGTGESFPNKDLINMIVKQTHSNYKNDLLPDDFKNFTLNINKIYNQTGWKPSITIWDGISMLIQEEKFKNPNTFDDFTKTIRSLYK